jgi:SAM-dependent methyltransferase
MDTEEFWNKSRFLTKFKKLDEKFINIRIDFYKKIFSKYNINNSNKKIIEVGTGSGELLIILSNIFNYVRGIDFSQKMIDNAKEILRVNKHLIKSGSDVDAIVSNMEDYDNYNVFDIILFSLSLSFSNVKKTIENLKKNCKKGTIIIIRETLRSFVYLEYVIKIDKKHKINKEKDQLKKWSNNIILLEKIMDYNFKKIDKNVVINKGMPLLQLVYVV